MFTSFAEQQKIAHILSTADKEIENLEQLIASKESHKNSLQQRLFKQTLRFKDENGNNYPDWEEKRLGEVADIVGGSTPSTSNPDFWDQINWFTPSEINSKYISESKRTISKAGLDNSSAKILPEGTILFTSRATIGEIGFATLKCTTNQGFQSFVVRNK